LQKKKERKKEITQGWVKWLTPAMPATWEAEIRRMEARGQTEQKNLGVVVHTCHSSYAGSINRRIKVQAGSGINVRSYLKNNESKRAKAVAQVVECLPAKSEALSSNPSTGRERNKEE
jgi:hypothetical protein